MLLLFYVLIFWTWGMWDLTSLTRDRPHIPCIRKQSLSHWTTREVSPIALVTNRQKLGGLKHHSPITVLQLWRPEVPDGLSGPDSFWGSKESRFFAFSTSKDCLHFWPTVPISLQPPLLLSNHLLLWPSDFPLVRTLWLHQAHLNNPK